MPGQRFLTAEAAPVAAALRPPVPVPALLRDVDVDAAAILAESIGAVAATPGRPAADAAVQPGGAVPAEAGGVRRMAGPPDAGMNTAEYAVGTLAAVAFAGLLLKVLTSDGVQAALAGVIQRALG